MSYSSGHQRSKLCRTELPAPAASTQRSQGTDPGSLGRRTHLGSVDLKTKAIKEKAVTNLSGPCLDKKNLSVSLLFAYEERSRRLSVRFVHNSREIPRTFRRGVGSSPTHSLGIFQRLSCCPCWHKKMRKMSRATSADICIRIPSGKSSGKSLKAALVE